MKGKLVIKQNSEEGDTTKDGTVGYSLGYLESSTEELKALSKGMHLIKWNIIEDVLIMVTDQKIKIIDENLVYIKLNQNCLDFFNTNKGVYKQINLNLYE